jgi:hypothetical protein
MTNKLIALLLVVAASAKAQPFNATSGTSWEITVDVFEGTLQGFFSEGEVGQCAFTLCFSCAISHSLDHGVSFSFNLLNMVLCFCSTLH